MSVLDRLPPLATTGVGSLPFGVAEAARHAVRAYDVPFCPQLPHLDGDMVAEWLGADPRRCGWAPDRDRARPRAWAAWLAELDRRPPAHGVVKLQVTGPLTLGVALGGTVPAADLAAWLAANAAEQVAVLRDRGLDPVLVVDEPALASVAGPGVEAAWDPLRAVAPAWGLHVCCAVPWPVVVRAAPDLLSFDPSTGSDEAALAAFGGHVAWGVLQPHRPEPLDVVRGRLAGVDAARALLTPACGTGRMAPARERLLAAELAALRLPAPRPAARTPRARTRPPAAR